MVLKLYGSPTSTCSRRVATIIYEKHIPYEFVHVDMMKGEHKSPSHLEKQPFGQVPYIDDDGFTLHESRAICCYLEAKYSDQGPKLAPSPSDLKANALFEQAPSIEYCDFDPHANKAVFEAILKPKYLGLPKDKAKYAEAVKMLSDKLDGYERILAKQKYLAGNEITLADLFHLPYGSMLVLAGSDLFETKGPNVARWWKEISSRESWKAVKDGIPTGTVKFD
ncbi:glutathione S-transferase [Dendrothele bispora CBS 962.96]|uniref:glutathione transferase n=1 Tax=Dendrothele bispora (strain CBS 962.96) TaxID=1314807 RepID=A0A4S8LCC3_DENBC|nr:glutathione S-transferase [Dendrothele bispora CBS 962.96]